MALETASGMPTATGAGLLGDLPTNLPSIVATATVTATPSAVAATTAPLAGDADNTQHASTSATVMIVIGCVVGILGVAGVITLIWWMRKRALAQQAYRATDLPQYYAPKPPPKGGPGLSTQKSLPQINFSSMPATRPERSNTVSSADKDKALPIKPLEAVWSPTQPKSPALSSVHEVTSTPRGRTEEEKTQARERSTSVGSYKAPQEFF